MSERLGDDLAGRAIVGRRKPESPAADFTGEPASAPGSTMRREKKRLIGVSKNAELVMKNGRFASCASAHSGLLTPFRTRADWRWSGNAASGRG